MLLHIKSVQRQGHLYNSLTGPCRIEVAICQGYTGPGFVIQDWEQDGEKSYVSEMGQRL